MATSFQERVLVLGASGARPEAMSIARGLERHGLQACLPGGGAGSPYESGSSERLRLALEGFAGQAGSGAPTPPELQPYVHPGITPWAERPEFPRICEEAGCRPVSASASALAPCSNRLSVLTRAEQLGIPHLALGLDPLTSAGEILRYFGRRPEAGRPALVSLLEPLLLKSTRRFGGLELLSIPGSSTLEDGALEAFERELPVWLEQLRMSVGEIQVFVERRLGEARAISLPFARLADGSTRFFAAVDSSLRARHRKVIEVCPAESLEIGRRRVLERSGVKLLDALKYVGVGRLEFLEDGLRHFLVDLVPGLGVGFELWERVSGIDALAWQLAALEPAAESARATPPASASPVPGFGLMAAVLAEDPLTGLPQPGRIARLRIPPMARSSGGTAAEFRLPLEEGQLVAPGGGFEATRLGTLLCSGLGRKTVFKAALEALGGLWIGGSLQTNERRLAELLEHPWVQEGIFSTEFIDEDFVPALEPPLELRGAFAALARSASGEPAHGASRGSSYDSGGDSGGARSVWLEGSARVNPAGSPPVDAGAAGAFAAGPDRWVTRIGRWFVVVRRAGVAAPGVRPVSRLRALSAGRVHAILYREGTVVPARETALLIESLGQLVAHRLSATVRLVRWRVSAEQEVEAGDELAELEPFEP